MGDKINGRRKASNWTLQALCVFYHIHHMWYCTKVSEFINIHINVLSRRLTSLSLPIIAPMKAQEPACCVMYPDTEPELMQLRHKGYIAGGQMHLHA